MRMSRVNIYLPDDLARDAKAAGVNVSALAQGAIRQALAAQATNAWLDSLAERVGPFVTHEQTMAALDAAREESATPHA